MRSHNFFRFPLVASCFLAPILACTPAFAAPLRHVEHVVVIGCDGMSPDGVLHAHSTVMRELMKTGAYTMHARGVMPTSSSPNWASLLMGAGPEQHGVTSNDWETNKFEITPTFTGPGGFFPTIFSVLRQQRPSAVIAVFHDWDGFGRLVEPGICNIKEDSDGPTNAIAHAVTYFQEHQPALTFVHLDLVDHAGHHDGHGTPEYFASVDVADKLIGQMIDGIKQAGVYDRTILLVTADHGGKGKGHGGNSMGELEIPWILHGPQVARGKEITKPVNTYDTAATLAYIFGLEQPEAWIAKPVRSAFSK